MKFVIPAGNVKIFARSIFSLAKLGDEIYIEPLDDSLTLRTVNSSRSAFSCFSFKRSFFTQFESSALHKNRTCIGGGGVGDQTLNTTVGALNETTNFRKGNNNDQSILVEDHEQFKCKLPAKSLLSIFRSITSLEKNIEKCTITVKYIPLSQDTIAAKVYEYDSTMITKMVNQNNEEQLYDTKFLIIMHSKYGVRKTFILSISDCESLQTAFLADNCTNRLNMSAKYFHETINSFSNDTEEITFLLEANKLVLRNYVEPESNDGKPLINTHVSFDSDEFNSYEIEKEMDITFCLKEFKICLMFGYYFDLPLDIYFKKKGRPIIFCYNRNEPNAHYEANFTLATLVDETVTSQSTITTVSADVTAASNSPVISLREAVNNNKNNNQLVSQHIDRQREEAAKTGHSILKTNAQNNKGNKRTIIFDGDVYLGNEETASREENNDNSADEDALLTQALNYQEQTFQQQVIETRPKSSTNLIEEPPSKKMKSLIQNMFEDDNSEENNQNRNEDEEEEKETNRFLKKRHGLVSLGHLLEEDTSRDSEEHNQQMEYHMTTKSRHHTSIYIENTDSEGE